jgi:hypothetical protein
MARLDDPDYEACAQKLAESAKANGGERFIKYECSKLCMQAAVYMRAVEILEGVDFDAVDDYVLTSEGPKDDDPVN